MFHLDNISIECFRGLKHLELQQLGRINLLVGPNNSGKTSVLEAVELFCNPFDLEEWVDTAWRRETPSPRSPLLDSLKWLFPQETAALSEELSQGTISLHADGTFSMREVKAQYRDFKSLGNGGADALDQEAIENVEEENKPPAGAQGIILQLECSGQDSSAEGPKNPQAFKLKKTFQIWAETKLFPRKKGPGPIIPVVLVTSISHRLEQRQIKQLTQLEKEFKTPLLLPALQKVDSNIRALKILSTTGAIPALFIEHAVHETQRLSPISVLGDGVRRALTIALHLVGAQGGILLIDELETFIHSSALCKLLSWLVDTCRSLNVQLFATTHSLEAVDAIIEATQKESCDDLVAYRLPQSGSGTKVVRLDFNDLKSLRMELGMEVR